MAEQFLARRCALKGVDAVEAASARSFARHSHDGYAIGRILAGGQKSWSGRGLVEARRGDMISANPGEVHDGMPLGGGRSWKMLYIMPDLVGAIVLDAEEGRTADFEFTSPVLERSRHAVAFELCYRAITAENADPDAAEERLILLLTQLLCERRPPEPVPASPAIARAKARIDADPAAPLRLAELALDAGLSRYQLLRGFAKLTGLTPHAYLVQRRTEAARRMIGRGTAIAEAAAACGFADQSHLNRAFVRRHGLTPGAYAAAIR